MVELGFVRLLAFGSLFVFNFSCLLLFLVPLKLRHMLYYFRPIGLKSLMS